MGGARLEHVRYAPNRTLIIVAPVLSASHPKDVQDTLSRVGSFAVDRSQFPVVHAHIDGTLADDQWLEFWVQLDALLTGERYGIVIDLRTAAELSASQRAYVVKNWKDNREQAARVCLIAAVVIKSGMWRGVFTAISWITPAPHPVAFVASIVEGDECVRTKLEEAWVPLGPHAPR